MKSSGRVKQTVPKARQVIHDGVVYMSSYAVAFDEMEDPNLARLPDAIRARVPALHEELATRPEQATPEIIALIERYPRVPLFANFLTAAHAQAGDLPASEQAAQEAYRQHPEDLFARVNYADLLRRKGDQARVAEVFDHKFDLPQLYPKRRTFHASEFATFTGVIGLYLCDTGKREVAKQLHAVMNQLVPEHPASELLGSELLPRTFKRLFGWRLRR